MRLFISTILISTLMACADNSSTVVNNYFFNAEDYKAGEVNYDSMPGGKTYLSVYSQIYQFTGQRTYNLTATISMRNTSLSVPVYIHAADYYNSGGEVEKKFVTESIVIKPMETVEIVINETQKEGGPGANFVFDWSSPDAENEPFFESVMISTSGQQGLSFSSQGKRIQ